MYQAFAADSGDGQARAGSFVERHAFYLYRGIHGRHLMIDSDTGLHHGADVLLLRERPLMSHDHGTVGILRVGRHTESKHRAIRFVRKHQVLGDSRGPAQT